MDWGGGGGGAAYKWIMGRSAIFKMADQSTINLYAGGGLVQHLLNRLLWHRGITGHICSGCATDTDLESLAEFAQISG